jgi:hypothetical protein
LGNVSDCEPPLATLAQILSCHHSDSSELPVAMFVTVPKSRRASDSSAAGPVALNSSSWALSRLPSGPVDSKVAPESRTTRQWTVPSAAWQVIPSDAATASWTKRSRNSGQAGVGMGTIPDEPEGVGCTPLGSGDVVVLPQPASTKRSVIITPTRDITARTLAGRSAPQ